MVSQSTLQTDFDNDIRRLKTVIEKYDRNSLINLLLGKLSQLDHWLHNGEMEHLKTLQHWSLLFILEFCFIYGQMGGQDTNENTLAELVNTLNDNANFLFLTHPDPRLLRVKTLRTVAFQQFYFQKKMNLSRISKEVWLFRHSPDTIKRQFKEITGYSLEYYYINFYFFMMWILNLTDPSKNVLTWRQWVKTISINSNDVRDYLLRNIKRRHSQNEADWVLPLEQIASPLIDVVWEPNDLLYRSFFFDYPVIKFPKNEKQFTILSRLLLQESLLKRPYRMLKAKFGQNFSGLFGLEVFEKYLQVGLKDTQKSFYTEDDLKNQDFSKQVDFIIVENNAFILIEAKAIEMTPYRQINFSQQDLEDGFKTTVVKGYTQIHYVAERLKTLFPNIPIYALIVTYEELFLGHGELIWYEWMNLAWQKEALNKQFYTAPFALKPENVFVVSADCYDFLIRLKRPISSFLEDAIVASANDGWLLLDQCLPGEDLMETPSYLQKSMDWLATKGPQLVAGNVAGNAELFKGCED